LSVKLGPSDSDFGVPHGSSNCRPLLQHLRTIALFDKTPKKPRSYLTPMKFVVISPLSPHARSGAHSKRSLIPISGTSFSLKSLSPGTYQWNLIAIIFASKWSMPRSRFPGHKKCSSRIRSVPLFLSSSGGASRRCGTAVFFSGKRKRGGLPSFLPGLAFPAPGTRIIKLSFSISLASLRRKITDVRTRAHLLMCLYPPAIHGAH